MRRFIRHFSRGACVTLAVATISVTAASTAPPPYPASLALRHGLLFGAGNDEPWGTVLTTAQARDIHRSERSTYRWGVWARNGGQMLFPVRSTDAGAKWTTAGEMLDSDFTQGSLYYVTKVIPESPAVVVMVSSSVIDVTIDAGHQWYQYMNPAADWTVATYTPHGSGIWLRMSPAPHTSSPRASYAIYVLDLAHDQWRRVDQSLG